MWLFFVLFWLGLLAVLAVVTQQAFGYDFARIPALFHALPPTQRFVTGALVFMILSLIAATIFQAYRITHQHRNLKSLRERIKGARQATMVAMGSQDHFDAAVQHLVDSDPEEAIASVEQKKTDRYRTKGGPAAQPQRSRRSGGSGGRDPRRKCPSRDGRRRRRQTADHGARVRRTQGPSASA